MSRAREAVPVAVVGMAAVFPGAPDVDTFWRNILGRVDAISPAPADRIDPVFFGDPASDGAADRFYCRRGGFIPDIEFEAAAYGVMPATARDAEPDQLLALATAARALADAGLGPSPERADRYGVVIGRGGYITPATARLAHRVHTAQQVVEVVRSILPDLGEAQLREIKGRFQDAVGRAAPESAIDIVPNLVASRTANRLDLHGPAYTVDAACASSLVALSHATEALAAGRADVMIAGGVHHCHDVSLWSVFSQLGALSRNERIRPFDRAADGIVIGEGTGMVVLKRLDDAERDGDRIYSVIRGVGLASDGRSGSLMSPSSDGQVRAMEAAWRAAGLDPRTVGLIEGHGTATNAGDAAELATLRRVVGGDPLCDPRVGLGSVKSMIGHAMPASGIAGFIKATLALHHGVLPPTLHCDDPHPALEGTRLVPVRESAPWEPAGGARRAGVNAFGFGGINGHVVLEEYAAPAARRTGAGPACVATAGARTTADAEAPATRLFVAAGATPAELLAQLADEETVLAGTALDTVPASAGPLRLAIADPTPRRLAVARQAVERGLPWRGRNDIWFSPSGLLSGGGRIAYVFPGLEGATGTSVEDVLEHFGLDLAEPAHATAVGREAVGLVRMGRALTHALTELGAPPDVVIGHSLGEWTAMMVAEVIAPEQSDAFVRGMMNEDHAYPDVAYLAVGCDAATARAAAEGTDVVLSHDNCPHQAILCGSDAGIAIARERLTAQRLLCQELPFRTGFHTPMFADHLDTFLAGVADLPLQAARRPIWSAITAAPFPADEAEIRALSRRLFVEPVRFRTAVEALHRAGVRAFVQPGVGAVTGFVGDTMQGLDHLAVAAADRARTGMAQLTRAAAALWVEGAPVDLSRLVAPRGVLGKGAAVGAAEAPTPRRLPTVRLRFDAGIARPDLDAYRPPAAPVPMPAYADQPDFSEFTAATGLTETFRVMAEASQQVVLAATLARSARADAPAVALRAPTPRPAPAPARAVPPADSRTPLLVSVETMPWLVDHCLIRQPDGFGTLEDRFAVVPMTTMVQLSVEAAERAGGGRVAVAVENAFAQKWLVGAPASEVEISTEEEAPGRVKVTIGDRFRATVLLDAAYPGEPEDRLPDLADVRPPGQTAREVYEQRWMFHGPGFQGIHETLAYGSNGIDGTVRALPAPGALLDAVGQLFGYWIAYSTTEDRMAFPYRIDRIDFFGPHPAAGDELTARVRIADLDSVLVRGVFDVVRADGRRWARITHFTDRRFEGGHDSIERMYFPETWTTGAQHGDYWFVHDTSSPANRDLLMRRHLDGRERARHESLPLRARKPWLLGRVAVKDAVRSWLWERGHGPIYPIQVPVHNEPGGRPTVHWPDHDLRISLAHTGSVAVAIVAEGADVGIDVEAVRPRGAAFEATALTDSERELLTGADPTERDRLVTRFWTAKEAVAKARGTGLQGRPGDFQVVELDGDWLRIGEQWVRSFLEQVPEGEFVVSHTARR